VCQGEIFIGELGSAVNGTRSSTIAIDEISALDHEIFDLCMLVQRRLVRLFGHIPLGGTCFPCSLEAVPWGSYSRQYKTGGNSLLSAG
jgi:hypothetical protein